MNFKKTALMILLTPFIIYGSNDLSTYDKLKKEAMALTMEMSDLGKKIEERNQLIMELTVVYARLNTKDENGVGELDSFIQRLELDNLLAGDFLLQELYAGLDYCHPGRLAVLRLWHEKSILKIQVKEYQQKTQQLLKNLKELDNLEEKNAHEKK